MIDKEILEVKSEQIRGEAKDWWIELTENDIDKASGNYKSLVSLLQDKYGYDRQHAAREVENRVMDMEARLRKVPSTIRPKKFK